MESFIDPRSSVHIMRPVSTFVDKEDYSHLIEKQPPQRFRKRIKCVFNLKGDDSSPIVQFIEEVKGKSGAERFEECMKKL